MHEVRANIFDYITVGEFKLKSDIEIINFSTLHKISPFVANNTMGIGYTKHAINLENLKLISQEIAKPLKRNDSPLDYLPTQYISDYIKSLGFDGVEYSITLHKGGFNLAIFNSEKFICKKTFVYQVKSLEYKEEQII